MALKRWLGAALLVSVFGFVGCTEPQRQDPASSPTAAQTTPTPAETVAVETPAETPAETPTPGATETPGDATATPTDAGTTAAAGGNEAMQEDLLLAEGMAGFEDVQGMEVPPSTPEMVAKGKELFVANCASCHGEDAKGGGPAGANLDPPPRDLTATDQYKYGHMELALFRTGTYGIEGTGMAPWEGIIPEEDQWAITHYVRSLQQ